MICRDCGKEMFISWEELFGRLWICKACFHWTSESWDKGLESGVEMGTPDILSEEGEKNA